MKTRVKILLYLMIAPCLFSCEDVVEEDIGDMKVVLRSPPDKYQGKATTTSFWWDEVEGADEYQILIVQPEFDYVEKLIVDSAVTGNKFSINLEAGKYQWKIRAKNGTYQSESAIWSLYLDSVSDIKDVTINLINPKTSLVTREQIIIFSWEANLLVEDYRFEIRSPDWLGSLVFPAQLQSTTSYTNTSNSLDEGIYEWGVQGQGDESNTSFSIRKITIDYSNPVSPVLNLPLNNSSQNTGNVTFSWNRPQDNGSKVKDSLFIYGDASLTTLARPIQVMDQTSYSDSLSPATYYWRVKSFDEAGNASNYSTTWNFNITQ